MKSHTYDKHFLAPALEKESTRSRANPMSRSIVVEDKNSLGMTHLKSRDRSLYHTTFRNSGDTIVVTQESKTRSPRSLTEKSAEEVVFHGRDTPS